MAMEVNIEQVATTVLSAAFRIHSVLGPGLLESAYEGCLVHELQRRGLRVERQVASPIVFEGFKIDVGYRIDLLVEGILIVELKAHQELLPIHHAQLLTYLKLSGRTLGLLINFHVVHLRDGVRRVVLNHDARSARRNISTAMDAKHAMSGSEEGT